MKNYSDTNKKHRSRLASHCSKERNNWGLFFHGSAHGCCNIQPCFPLTQAVAPVWLGCLHTDVFSSSCTLHSFQKAVPWLHHIPVEAPFQQKKSKTFHDWLYLLFKHLKGNIKTCSRAQQQVSKLFVCWLKKWYNRNSTLFASEVNHSPALSL